MDYHREHNLEIKIARILTHMAQIWLLTMEECFKLYFQAINNKKITINGNGTQTRSFQYIADLIDGLIKMMETDFDFIGPLNLEILMKFQLMN